MLLLQGDQSVLHGVLGEFPPFVGFRPLRQRARDGDVPHALSAFSLPHGEREGGVADVIRVDTVRFRGARIGEIGDSDCLLCYSVIFNWLAD